MQIRLDATLQRAIGTGQQYGMQLLEIRPNSPAERAELKRLDIIVSADDEAVMEARDLQRVVRRHRPGEKMVIGFLRGGKLRRVTAIL